MKIEVKLDDSRFCAGTQAGCPFLDHNGNDYCCYMGFFDKPKRVYLDTKNDKIVSEEEFKKNIQYKKLKALRPQECIDKYGE